MKGTVNKLPKLHNFEFHVLHFLRDQLNELLILYAYRSQRKDLQTAPDKFSLVFPDFKYEILI